MLVYILNLIMLKEFMSPEFLSTFKKKDLIYLFLERGEGREKERKRNINCLPLVCVPTGDQTLNLGMCPDRN